MIIERKEDGRASEAKETQRRQVHFVVRRAFRSAGRFCERADVMTAFGISATSASTVLRDALALCPGLVRKERKIQAPAWEHAPAFAGEEDLLEHLEAGRDSYGDIGLTREELPITRVIWRKNLPSAPGALEEIVRCIVASRPVLLHYTTIEAGRQASWRRILPLRLEQVNTHWRVTAHSLDLPGFPLRTFALTRIVGFKVDPERAPRALVPENPHDALTKLKVTLDRRMTPEQDKAMRSEFGIRDGCVEVPHRSVYEFMQQFVAGAEVQSTAIWPPFQAAEVVR